MPKRLERRAVCESFGPYVRCLCDMMGLRDWAIGISRDQPPRDADADIVWIEGTKQAVFRVSDEFLADPEEEQRATLVHELVHAHFEPARVIAERAMGRRWDDFRLIFEMGIDGVAQSWAERLPLPSQVKPRRKRS